MTSLNGISTAVLLLAIGMPGCPSQNRNVVVSDKEIINMMEGPTANHINNDQMLEMHKPLNTNPGCVMLEDDELKDGYYKPIIRNSFNPANIKDPAIRNYWHQIISRR